MKIIHNIPFWQKHSQLVHAFSTKTLGNLSFRTGQREVIQDRRKILMQNLNLQWEDVLILPLSHSNRVLSLSKNDLITKDAGSVYLKGGHLFSATESLVHYNKEWQSGIDAVVTDVLGIFPVIMSADCAAVGFFDPNTKVFALAHVGLIGAVNQIVINVIRCMITEYHVEAKNIEVVIFPSIRKCHYDLSVSGAWKRIKSDVLEHYGLSNSIFNGNNFDLQGLICCQLIDEGVLKGNIYDSGLCTVCSHDMFFSNLAAGDSESKKVEGRFISIMGVKNER